MISKKRIKTQNQYIQQTGIIYPDFFFLENVLSHIIMLLKLMTNFKINMSKIKEGLYPSYNDKHVYLNYLLKVK